MGTPEKTRSHQPPRDGLLEEQLRHCLEEVQSEVVTDIKRHTRLKRVYWDI